jgi:hypothetical protein
VKDNVRRSSVSIEVPGAARCPAATLVTDPRAGTLRLQPDTLGRAQHLPDNMRRRRIPTCGRTLQCEKCQAFESGDGERWSGAGLAALRRSKLAAAGLEGQQHWSLNRAPRRALERAPWWRSCNRPWGGIIMRCRPRNTAAC